MALTPYDEIIIHTHDNGKTLAQQLIDDNYSIYTLFLKLKDVNGLDFARCRYESHAWKFVLKDLSDSSVIWSLIFECPLDQKHEIIQYCFGVKYWKALSGWYPGRLDTVCYFLLPHLAPTTENLEHVFKIFTTTKNLHILMEFAKIGNRDVIRDRLIVWFTEFLPNPKALQHVLFRNYFYCLPTLVEIIPELYSLIDTLLNTKQRHALVELLHRQENNRLKVIMHDDGLLGVVARIYLRP